MLQDGRALTFVRARRSLGYAWAHGGGPGAALVREAARCSGCNAVRCRAAGERRPSSAPACRGSLLAEVQGRAPAGGLFALVLRLCSARFMIMIMIKVIWLGPTIGCGRKPPEHIGTRPRQWAASMRFFSAPQFCNQFWAPDGGQCGRGRPCPAAICARPPGNDPTCHAQPLQAFLLGEVSSPQSSD